MTNMLSKPFLSCEKDLKLNETCCQHLSLIGNEWSRPGVLSQGTCVQRHVWQFETKTEQLFDRPDQ